MKTIGIVPAAGIASRLLPLRYPKELLPIVFERRPGEGELRPRLAISSALEQLRRAHVERCHLIVSDQKWELLRYLGSGASFGLAVSYLVQVEPRGLAHAVDCAYPWTRGPETLSCLVLPDTVCRPDTALLELGDLLFRTSADVALGVFPTSRPQQLGPVELDGEGGVVRIQDKPASPVRANTWGMGCWTSRFAELLHQRVASANAATELALGHVFGDAIREGLRVVGREFRDGEFFDLGTPSGIAEFTAKGAVA